jgi:iron(III) transport system substrate-binding protein
MTNIRRISTAFAVVGTITLSLAGVPRAQDLAALHKAAQNEKTLSWCNGSLPDASAARVIEAFAKKYPGIRVNSLRATSQVAYQRLMQDLENNMFNCDVFGSGDGGHFIELKRRGDLLDYEVAAARSIGPEFRDLYEPGQYYPATTFLMVMAYNKNLVPAANAPTNWSDLIDPKWKGKVAIAHPAYSGNIGNWAVFMQSLYGDQFFQKLADNQPLVGRSSGDPVAQLAAGERQIGITPMAEVQAAIKKGAPIEIVYPTDGSLVIVTHMAILKKAPHPNAAKLFMEYVLGPEFGALMVADGRHSLDPAVSTPPGVKKISEIKTGRLTIEQSTKGIGPLIEKWNAIFGG